MKGYKGFDKGLTCRGFQYKVGETYKHDGEIILCKVGFHFCKNIADVAYYYTHKDSEFAEIEAIGKVVEGDNKCVTNKIKIIRIINQSEFYELANTGKDNSGINNVGNRNTGDWNTGDCNTGDWNTGYCNNTDRSTGFFCTDVQTVKIFDMETEQTYEEVVNILPIVLWDIPFNYYWNDNEWKQYTADDRQNFYDGLPKSDQEAIKSMPFFDAEKFEKCTGIKVED